MSLLLLLGSPAGGGVTPTIGVPWARPVPRARVRLYDGSRLTKGIRQRARQTVGASGSGLSGGTATVTFPDTPGEGSLLVFAVRVLAPGGGHPTLTTPSGWTAGPTQTSGAGAGDVKIWTYYRVAPLGGSRTVSASLSATAAWDAVAGEWPGVALASPLDVSASATGSGTSPSSGATGATSQADAFALGIVGTVGSVTFTPTGGYGAVKQQDRLYLEQKLLSATGAQTATATLGSSTSWAAMVLVFKGADVLPSAPFAPLGELDSGEFRAVARLAQMGEFEGTFPESDPATAYLMPNTIVEVWVPDETPWTLGWYVVRHLSIDEGHPARPVTVRALDLRTLIDQQTIEQATATGAKDGTGRTVEQWLRRYLERAGLVDDAASFPTTDRVPTLALATAIGGTSDYGVDAPVQADAPFGQTAVTLLAREGAGWRVNLLDPGLVTGKLQWALYRGTDRTLGQAGEAVFALQWDTAEALTWTRDAIDAATELNVKGAGATWNVADLASFSEWGPLRGRVNASNELATIVTSTHGADVSLAYLLRRVPKTWADVVPARHPSLRAGTHYALGDTVTVLLPDGTRIDQRITEITLESGAPAPAVGRRPEDLMPGGSVAAALRAAFGRPEDRWRLVVGDSALLAPEGRDRAPVAVNPAVERTASLLSSDGTTPVTITYLGTE